MASRRLNRSEDLAQFRSQPPPFIMQQFDWPHPAAGDALLLVATAKVDSCFSSFCVWQWGHSGVWLPNRIASNLWPQDSQRYSKIGIDRSNILSQKTRSRTPAAADDTNIIDVGARQSASRAEPVQAWERIGVDWAGRILASGAPRFNKLFP